ncbi:hypothetical protein OKA05_29170 [Luteolibacter arcticus]|uniref:Uncharacterized protein n=1 Tax=Luteolibacter arcticus TaxID=1581411 RepID=A0ABT3GT53_9BACT|nr:hypothetical protein [Luteolibacter arcticus]MCW1926660.1 hypothetical protein [Luteolibacter arcticus]
MKQLDDAAFRATFGEPMVPVTDDEEPPFDFWDYFEEIPEDDFEGYDCSAGAVDQAWRTPDGRFEHVLVNSEEEADVFMVVVLDRDAGVVHGHRLLHLKDEYGMP